MVTNPKSKKTSENGKSIKYMKLKKMQGGAQKAPMKYAPEVAPTATSNSLKWWIAGAYLLSLVAIAGLAAALTVGVLGYEKAKGNTFENNTQVVIYNITNNITEIIYVNSTSNASGTGIVETIVPGPGINVTDTDPANPIVWNTGLYDAFAGAGILIDKTDPHNPIFSATGSSNASSSCITAFYYDVTAADLNAGVVTIFSATGSTQYLESIFLYFNASVDFDLGGDRDVVITPNFGNDNVNGFTIPSADLQNLFSAYFDGNAFYYGMFTPKITIPTGSITASYSGGTTNYASGILSLFIVQLDVSSNCSSSGGSGSGIVETIEPGLGISVDSTDPASPIVTNIGIRNITEGENISINRTDPYNPIISATGGGALPQAVLYNDGSIGDLFLLTKVNGNFGLYNDVTQVFSFANQSTIPTVDGTSQPNGLVIDSNENGYIIGYFYNGNLAFGDTTLTANLQGNCYIAKFDSNGNWIWAIQSTNTGYCEGIAIAVDDSDNIYITGNFYGDVDFGSTTLTSTGGGGDTFVAKADSDGNWILAFMSTSYDPINGGSSGHSIYVDSTGFIYVGGQFYINETFGTTTLESVNYQVYLAKSNATGSWIWAIQDTGSGTSSEIRSITSTTDGNIYATGFFIDDATFGSTTLTSPGITTLFVAKADSTGSWIWAVDATADTYAESNSIIVDSFNNLYIAGYVTGATVFGSTTINNEAVNVMFLAKADSTGSWIWAIQNTGDCQISSNQRLDIYADSFIAVTGPFSGAEAIFGSHSITPGASTGFIQAYISKATTDGEWIWALSGDRTIASNNAGIDIKFLSDGNLYNIGMFSYQITFEPFTLTSPDGHQQNYITKISGDGNTVIYQFAMLAESGVITDVVSFATNGLITGASGFITGTYYYYNPDTNALTIITTAFPIGYAMSTTSFLMTPVNPLFTP